ncbi:MAG: PqqD family protein [Deltaproteobacteria bacterium]|nr:PqqD family protein [Deltaproteobacteria bacterium]MBW2136917.1 PqqD family protein [Deltaproteobacteria bacterium]
MGHLQKNPMFVTRMVEGEGYLVPLSPRGEDIRKVYRLNPVGWFLWQSIDGEQDLEAICSEISRHYDVDSEVALSDARKYIEELLRIGALSSEGD